MTALQLSSLRKDASTEVATDWIGEAVFAIGQGFHPDTRAADYVNIQTGSPSFEPDACRTLSESLDVAFGLLGDNVYQESCWFAWRLLNGLPRQPAQDVHWHLLNALQILHPTRSFSDERAFQNGDPPVTIESAITVVRELHQPPAK